MNVIFLSISRKRLGMTCSSLLLNTVLLQRYTALSFFSTAIHSIFLVLDVTKSSHLFDRINRQSRAWLFFEVEEPIRERRKAFCSAQKENRELITRLLDMLHLSLQRLRGGIKHDPISPSHKTDSHSVYSLFQSVAVLLHFSFSSPNYPNWSSPRESALVYTSYLRSHFSVSHPQALLSKGKIYLPALLGLLSSLFLSLLVNLSRLPPVFLFHQCRSKWEEVSTPVQMGGGFNPGPNGRRLQRRSKWEEASAGKPEQTGSALYDKAVSALPSKQLTRTPEPTAPK